MSASTTQLRARRQLALRLIAGGRHAEAADELTAVLQIEPGSIEDRLHLGVARHLAGRHEEAIDLFRQVTAREPGLPAGWCNLGLALRAAGRPEEAVRALERAVALDPTLASAAANLALSRLDLADPTAALAACQRGLDANDQSALLHRAMARVQASIGEHETAEVHLRTAIALEPGSPAVHLEHAEALRRSGGLDAAKEAIDRATALDPGCAAARAAAVELHLLQGETEEALAAAEESLARSPGEIPAVLAAASARIATGRSTEAAALLDAALTREDLSSAQRRLCLFRLGEARDRLADYDAAWNAFAEANRLKGVRFDRGAFAQRARAIMDVFDREALTLLPQAAAGGAPRPIFIAGVPRSGSTLVEQILDSHPEVRGLGEIGLMERLENRLAAITGRADPFPGCVRAFTQEDVERLAAIGRDMLARAAGGAPVVVEKSMSNGWYLGLIELAFPGACVILCERERLDTCLSCWFQDFSGHLPWAYDLDDIAFFHRWNERLAGHWRRTLALRMETIRYESLVSDPERVIRRMLDFCGLAWDERCLAFHKNSRPVLTASSAQVRRPIYASSVGRHRHYARHLAPLRQPRGRVAAP